MRKPEIKTGNPIIATLDVMDRKKAFGLVDKIIKAGLFNHGVWGVKVGEPALNQKSIIMKLLARGIRVYSDPMLYVPIPGKMPRQIAYYTPANIISICASMHDEAMREAVKHAPTSRITALLVPSSFDDAICQSKYGRDIEGATYEFAFHAKNCGVHALICTPREYEILKRYREFHDMWWIAVAVRPEGYGGTGGHQETITPRKALENGADFLVIGGPITDAPDPILAIKKILEEIKDFLP